MSLSFTIPGKLRGKGRIRHNGKQHFMDEKTRAFETSVQWLAREAMNGKELYEGPVLLNITIWQLIPKSWSKAKQLAAGYATGRPDLDNIAKGIADSINGIVYRDDAQIASLHVTRHYGTVEKTTVVIEPLNGWRERKKLAS